MSCPLLPAITWLRGGPGLVFPNTHARRDSRLSLWVCLEDGHHADAVADADADADVTLASTCRPPTAAPRSCDTCPWNDDHCVDAIPGQAPSVTLGGMAGHGAGAGSGVSTDGAPGDTLAGLSAPVAWLSFPPPASPTSAIHVHRYRLTSVSSPNRGCDPSGWWLEGSHDGATWVKMDSRQAEVFDRPLHQREFFVQSSVGWFPHHRLCVFRTAGNQPAGLHAASLSCPPVPGPPSAASCSWSFPTGWSLTLHRCPGSVKHQLCLHTPDHRLSLVPDATIPSLRWTQIEMHVSNPTADDGTAGCCSHSVSLTISALGERTPPTTVSCPSISCPPSICRFPTTASLTVGTRLTGGLYGLEWRRSRSLRGSESAPPPPPRSPPVGIPARLQSVRPITSVRDLLLWTAVGCDAVHVSSERLARRYPTPSSTASTVPSPSRSRCHRPGLTDPSRPLTLVCHDCGPTVYHEDCALVGCCAGTPAVNPSSYRFIAWHCIDVFVYFSHAFVTIPPFGWTTAAHRHGVRMLGTVITEWEDGARLNAQLLRWPELAAEALASVAATHGFDGWLLNIEARVDDPSAAAAMTTFVSVLTARVHATNPDGLVIWYDSLTVDGRVAWQSCLNARNKPFFDAADGVFLDYHWKPDAPRASSDVAGDRSHDVFLGVDVWGRGTPGGGQWACGPALRTATRAGLSAAVFAPAWMYETQGGRGGDDAAFYKLEAKFWSQWEPPVRVDVPVDNPCGAAGTDAGWRVVDNGGQGWNVVTLPPPDRPDPDVTTAFVTSHMWAVKEQTTMLDTAWAALPPDCESAVLEVDEWVKGTGPDFADCYRLEVTVLDADKGVVGSVFRREETTGEVWRRVGVQVAVSRATAVSVTVRHCGKDTEAWAGHFGAVMTGTRVALVHTPADRAGASVASRRVHTPRSIASSLPFHSTFDSGCSPAGVWIRGRQVSTTPWFDLSLQGPLPTFVGKECVDPAASIGVASATCQLVRDEAFDGGGCLEVGVNWGGGSDGGTATLQLFVVDIPLASPPQLTLRVTFNGRGPPTSVTMQPCVKVGGDSDEWLLPLQSELVAESVVESWTTCTWNMTLPPAAARLCMLGVRVTCDTTCSTTPVSSRVLVGEFGVRDGAAVAGEADSDAVDDVLQVPGGLDPLSPGYPLDGTPSHLLITAVPRRRHRSYDVFSGSAFVARTPAPHTSVPLSTFADPAAPIRVVPTLSMEAGFPVART